MCVCVCVCVQWFVISKELNNYVLVVPHCESVGKKDICLVEVYTGIAGHREKFPIVCLKGEKILHVVKERMTKNQKVLMNHC